MSIDSVTYTGLNIVLHNNFWLSCILSYTWLKTLASHNEHWVLYRLKTASYLNSAGVGLESSGGVFGGYSALDGTAIHPDLILFEVELWQAAAFTYMQLSVHQVHTVK